MFQFNKKSSVSIEIKDYVLRGLVKKGPDVHQWHVVEIEVPKDVVEEASIVDEMALFELIKSNVTKLGGKKQSARIFVPDTSVLLKVFEHPAKVKSDALKEYVEMELGRTIHLPFQDPLIDVYDANPDDGQAVIFAVPPDEVGKFTGILHDVHLHPEVADIRALSNLRVLEKMNIIDDEKTYLIADWLINELIICIYSNGNVEFLRFQVIDTDMSKWVASIKENGVDFTYSGDLEDYILRITDQVLELDRILNFFRFSLHKGERTVDEIIMMGDNPQIVEISNLIRENIATPITMIDDAVIGKHFPQFKAKHASLIGLALKEV